jgi:hypothetical protein
VVKRSSGFKVIYGPIRAGDLPAFLGAGFKATPEMRVKTFTIRERVVLIPAELVGALKVVLLVLPVIFLTDSLWRAGGFWSNGLSRGLDSVLAIWRPSLQVRFNSSIVLVARSRLLFQRLIAVVLSPWRSDGFPWRSWNTWPDRLEIIASVV